MAAFMVRRSIYREVPWFLAYTVYQVFRFAVLFVAYHSSYRIYFYLYWLGEGIDALITLIVIQEIYNQAFRSYEILRSLSTILFRWAAIVLFAVMVLVAMTSGRSGHSEFVSRLLIVDRSVSFVQCGLLCLLFVFKQAVGLPGSALSRGIALGLGITSAATAVTLTVSYSNPSLSALFGLILTLTYDLAILIWILTVLRSEVRAETDSLVSSELLRKWDSTLLGITRR